jgi:hypothetical protein
MNPDHGHNQTGTRDHQDRGITAYKEEWPCIGAVNVDKERVLVLWKSTWHSSLEYHSLRAKGHKGWLVFAVLEDRILMDWEPTVEMKSAQSLPEALIVEFAMEVRKHRPGLLGYVAAKYMDSPSSNGGRRLAFLAYWKTVPMPQAKFLRLRGEFSSHRGRVVHIEKETVWIQWEPTWVYYEDLDQKKRALLYDLRSDPEALLARFHKTVVDYSTIVQVQKRVSNT